MRIRPVFASFLRLSTGCHRSVSAHSGDAQLRAERSYRDALVADPHSMLLILQILRRLISRKESVLASRSRGVTSASARIFLCF
jgi:hypothetical protein